MEIVFKKGDLVKITKVSVNPTSIFQKGFHPNGIEEGYINFGYIAKDIVIGHPLFLSQGPGYSFNFHTSDIIEIISNNTFKTMNSIYELDAFILE